jgi:Tetratricopeptide repeat
MLKKPVLILLSILCSVIFLQAQQVEVLIGGSVPLGPQLSNGQEIYKIGPVISGTSYFPLNKTRNLYGVARVGYLNSITYADEPFTLISLAPGLEFRYQLGRLLFSASALTGAYFALFDGENAVDFMVQGGPSFRFLLTPEITLGLSANYTHCFADSFSKSMYSGIQISFGSTLSVGSTSDKPLIDYRNILLNPVFPVFYSYYDTNEIGNLTIENSNPVEIRQVSVKFFNPEYMDRPKECLSLDVLPPGSSTDVKLYGLFNKSILTTTEGTIVPGEISISYNYMGKPYEMKTQESLTIENRNAMTWDDDRKAASFITSRDEDILRFGKNTASFVRSSESKIINRTFRIAMGMFRALDIYGLRYVVDPVTPYKAFSEDSEAVDYLQFPGQTLSFRGGDCDDLSILYSALLESVGIETAFITVPGHILLAFNADVLPGEASTMFVNADDLIITKEKTWVPVEVTMIQEDFLSAWREGAKLWRQFEQTGLSKILPVRKAWETYKPVDRPPLNTRVIPFDPMEMASDYQKDLDQMTAFQIQERVHKLEAEIAGRNSDKEKLINRLGILYARYGLYTKAKREFSRIAEISYFPAVLNLGNIHFLQGEYEQALKFYLQAIGINNENTLAQLGVARVQYELENYNEAQAAFQIVQKNNPGTASQFSYLANTGLDSTTRASDSEVREEGMIWDN